MIENNEYIYKDVRTFAILPVLGFLLGVFIGYITGDIEDVKVKEVSFNAKNLMATLDSKSSQDKPIQKVN